MGKLNMKLQEGADNINNTFEADKSSSQKVPAGESPAESPKQVDQQPPQKPQEATKISPAVKKSKAEEKAVEKANTKPQKQVFSFRAQKESIEKWKAYATATGLTMENIGSAAMKEYLSRHKLEGAEKDIYTAILSRNNM